MNVRETEVHEGTRLSNRKFAETDTNFQAACEAAGVKPSARQASKYRNGMGAARRGSLL
jgi:hypothetical protein